MKENINTHTALGYLQAMLNHYQRDLERYGDCEETDELLTKMLACKDMVEALIGMPVNLQRDGKVTVGF